MFWQNFLGLFLQHTVHRTFWMLYPVCILIDSFRFWYPFELRENIYNLHLPSLWKSTYYILQSQIYSSHWKIIHTMFGRIEIKMDDRAPYSFFFSFFLVVAVPRLDFKWESKLFWLVFKEIYPILWDLESRTKLSFLVKWLRMISWGSRTLQGEAKVLRPSSNWGQKLRQVLIMLCPYQSVETMMFFWHSYFMWNQFWPFYSYKNCHLGCF